MLREELDFERLKIEEMKKEAEDGVRMSKSGLISSRNYISVRSFRKNKCQWVELPKHQLRISYIKLIVECKSGQYAWVVKGN